MPRRDGVDHYAIAKCSLHCGLCSRACSKALTDWELRSDGWHPIADAPLDAYELEGLTSDGARLVIHYHAAGDYADRWVCPSRGLVTLTHWRHLASSRFIMIGPLG